MNIARDTQYQVCICGLISKLFLEVWAVWIQKRAFWLVVRSLLNSSEGCVWDMGWRGGGKEGDAVVLATMIRGVD
jgi:hypothetical protein